MEGCLEFLFTSSLISPCVMHGFGQYYQRLEVIQTLITYYRNSPLN